MNSIAYFSVQERRREKEESRRRDEACLESGLVSQHELALRNGLFAVLDPARARVRFRRPRLQVA
jgi:hypothetical protein